MARDLSTLGIKTCLIADTAVMSVMSRVSKVVASTSAGFSFIAFLFYD
jgi:translation initiation factor 2B subunit (eIF-2B alpha/beta/delta family)